MTICIGMPIALVSAYTLSRMEFPGRKIIKNALLITMVIPVMATIIPLYKMFSAGHMLDNTFLAEYGLCKFVSADGNVDDYELFFDNSKRAGRGGTY